MTKKQLLEDLEAVLNKPILNIGALKNAIRGAMAQHRPSPAKKEPAPKPPLEEAAPEPANQMAPSAIAQPAAEKPASDDLDDW